MNAAAKHTPGPWAVDPTDAEGRTVSTTDSRAIAECGLDYSSLPSNGRANAARIVQCVNAHDDLVAALRQARAMIGDGPYVRAIDAALAKAGEA